MRSSVQLMYGEITIISLEMKKRRKDREEKLLGIFSATRHTSREESSVSKSVNFLFTSRVWQIQEEI